MRLTFLEPDVLIVDEVLAVGDQEFQQRCHEKLKSISNSGRTILLVSHIMNTISTLSHRVMHIESGKIKSFGKTNEVVAGYISGTYSNKHEVYFEEKRPGDDVAECIYARVVDGNHNPRVSLIGVNQ